MRMVLRSLGVTTVWEAADGHEAVELYAKHQPVVVFLDQNMPQMPGKVAIDRLLEIDAAAAVVVLTSENDAETIKYFAEHGAIAYVLKCCSRQKLSAEIDEILDCFVVDAV